MSKKLNAEQKAKQIEQVNTILNLTNLITDVVNQMEGPSCKKAFEYSTKGLYKKCEQFSSASAERFHVTEEEKEYIKAIREGKIKVPALPSNGENADISIEQHDGKKKGKKNN